MSSDEKLMDMLTGYAAAHRHPFNIAELARRIGAMPIAAPFFTVVEMFKILGLRDDLFNEVQKKIDNSPVENSSS